MNAATSFAYRPIQVSHRPFPRLNKFSSFQLDLSHKFISKTSISHSTRYTSPLTMDSFTNRAEGFNVGDIEQEDLIDGSINFSSDGIQATLNSLSIFYTVAICIISMVEYFGFNGITAVTSALIFAMGSYFSWLRVSQRFHTLNQVAVGAVLGFCFSIFWFWLWDAIVMKAFVAHFWVQIVAVVGAAGCCVGFILYVNRNWVNDDKH